MNIEHISVSRSKTYKQCPMLYKYQYHLRVPSPIDEPLYFFYGKFIHLVAETYVREKGQRSLNEIVVDIKQGRIEIEPGKVYQPLPKEYERRLPIHLRSILRLTSKIGCEGITEHAFYYDLEPPNKKNVKGFIDRLIIKGDQAFIIDYKTTKKGDWRVNKETVKTDLQLRCYARVVQKEFGIVPEKITCALFYLEDEELVASRFSEASLVAAEADLLAIYNEIVEHDPEQVYGKTGKHCCRCAYESICPFYRNTKATQAWDGTMRGSW